MRPPVRILLFAAWLAFAAGLLEATYRLIRFSLVGWGLNGNGDLLWTAPLANLIWLGLPALLLAFAAAVFPRITTRLAIAVLVFIAAFGLSFVLTGFHRGAAALLAMGVAVQAAHLLRTREEAVTHFVVRSLPVLTALTLVLGVGRSALMDIAERRESRSLAAPASRMNVLLLVLDTARGMNFSLHGYERLTTPGLERWARRGTRFDLAIAPSPWTLPSHASMFTGRLPRDLSTTLKKPLDGTYPVLAEALARQGYVTGGFVANLSYCSREHGLARGFLHFEDYPRSLGGIVYSSLLGRWLFDQPITRRVLGYHDLLWRKRAADVNREFLDWQQGLGDRPFFAFLNYFDTHRPFLPEAPYDKRFARWPDRTYDPGEIIVDYDETTPDEIAWNLDRYDGLISYLDAQIDSLLQELDRRGVLDSTLVIVTSDHGEHFGEHERLSHGNSLYLHLTQVPLLMLGAPAVPAGRVVDFPVSLVCLPATILGLAGLPNQPTFSCPSIASAWQPGAKQTAPVIAEMPGRSASTGYSVIEDGYHLVKWFENPAELYDIVRDSMETMDLAHDSSMAGVFQRFTLLADRVRRPRSASDSLPVESTRARGVVDVDNNTPQPAKP